MSAEQPLRCARCGVESAEPACFIVPRPFGPPPREVRCIACAEQGAKKLSLGVLVRSLLVWLAPLAAVALSGRPWPEFVAAALLWPAAIMAHELGHVLAVWLLGLELGAVVIGQGPALLRFELGGVTIRVQAIPFSGFVFFGSRSLRGLRTRIWLVRLMGPVASGAWLAWTFLGWERWAAFLGPAAAFCWMGINLLLLMASLLPTGRAARDQNRWSDGAALFKIPFLRREVLAPLLVFVPRLRAAARYERDDVPGTRRWVLTGLGRAPEDVLLNASLAECHILAGEYAAALALLTPLLARVDTEAPRLRVAVQCDLAFALLMSHRTGGGSEAGLDEAERLSAAAFATFPCVLQSRSTRALALCVRQRPADALALLDYVHYERAAPRQWACREAVRALAFTALGQAAEARAAAQRAVQRHAASRRWLQSLGLLGEPAVDRAAPEALTTAP